MQLTARSRASQVTFSFSTNADRAPQLKALVRLLACVMERVNILKLETRLREGGNGATAREYLDFVVDGKPLSERIAGDLASCLGWLSPEENAKAIARLLLEEQADLPNNRRSLYVCPECGDLGCGAVSVVIESVGEHIVWRDFGLQNNYQDEVVSAGYEDVGSFIFNRTQYEAVIRSAS